MNRCTARCLKPKYPFDLLRITRKSSLLLLRQVSPRYGNGVVAFCASFATIRKILRFLRHFYFYFISRTICNATDRFVSFEKPDDSLAVDCYIGVCLAKFIFFNSSTEARACGEYWEKYYSIRT